MRFLTRRRRQGGGLAAPVDDFNPGPDYFGPRLFPGRYFAVRYFA